MPTPEPNPHALNNAQISEGQSWIVGYLINLKPWLRKSSWDDLTNKMRSHDPDIYAILEAKGKIESK